MLIIIAAAITAAPATVMLGGLFPRFRIGGRKDGSGIERLAAFRMAIAEINNKTDGLADDLLPDTRIEFAVRDSKRNDGVALVEALGLINPAGAVRASAIIGAASSGPSLAVAMLTGVLQVPQISYSSTSPLLSDGNQYPYFLRTPPSDAFQADGIIEVASSLFGYTALAAVSTTDSYGAAGFAALSTAAAAAGVEITVSITFNREATDLFDKLQQLKGSRMRAIVIFAQAGDAGRFMRLAYEAGIGGEGYMWLGSDSLCKPDTWLLDEGGMADDLELRESVMRGFFGLAPSRGTGPLYDAFAQRLLQLPNTIGAENGDCDPELDSTGALLWAGDHDGDPSTPLQCAGSAHTSVNSYAPYSYDAVYAVARAMHTLFHQQGREMIEGSELLDVLLRNVSFAGASGPVAFYDARAHPDALYNGDRREGVSYDVWNYQSVSAELVRAGTWTPCGAGCPWESSWRESGEPLVYSTTDNSVPPQSVAPKTCGSLTTREESGEGEETCDPLPLILVLVLSVGLLCVVAIGSAYWTRRARQRAPLRLVSSGEPPTLHLGEGKVWHCFISHVWATGQDQAGMIKRWLVTHCALRCFLDVDDLQDLSQLEDQVSKAALVIIFLSKGYFQSKSILAEA